LLIPETELETNNVVLHSHILQSTSQMIKLRLAGKWCPLAVAGRHFLG